MSGEKLLLETLIKIRDSTFRNSMQLRMIADDAINRYKADTVLHYITKESSEPSQIPNCS